jgi:D-xylose transport system permease protein
MGMMLCIVSGNFDLAVGSVVALVGGFAAIMQVNYHMNTALVIMLALLLGAVLGIWQGFWVAYRKVPSFIVTLGDMLIFRGIYLTVGKGKTISPMNTGFTAIMTTFIPKTAGWVLGAIAIGGLIYTLFMRRRSQIKYSLRVDPVWIVFLKIVIGSGLIFWFVYSLNGFQGIPLAMLVLVIVVLIFQVITTKTRFARRVYAIGGNNEAAKLAGINVRRYVASMFIITGMLSALSAILLTSRLNAAVAGAGNSYEMDVISAVVVGGTSLSGGKGTIIGAVIGSVLIASLSNGMSLLNIDSYVQNIVKGMVLILAVWFDVATQTKAK